MKASLGLSELLYVDDLPIITATYGYTRRDFEPIYDELGAQNLPVEIRAFPSVQKAAAQRLGKMDLVGTIPILAREGEHEGIFMSLLPDRVIDWLALNDITLPDAHLPPIARILAALETIDRDRYYDSIWQLRIRRIVFGLIHSLSHAAMRAMTRYAGIDRTSVAEYIFLPLLGCVVYDSSSSFKLGGVATLVRITWQPSCETLRTTRWNASTIPIVGPHGGLPRLPAFPRNILPRIQSRPISSIPARRSCAVGRCFFGRADVGYWDMQGRQR